MSDPKTSMQQSRVFSGFSDTGLQILAGIAQREAVPAGARVFEESQESAALYLIQSGTVRVVARDSAGAELTLATLGVGEHLGGLSLLRGGKHVVSAIADTDVELWRFDQKAFSKLQREKPQACVKLMINIVEDLGQRLDGASPLFREFLTWRLGRS